MLHEIASTSHESIFKSQRWSGRRVFAIDGTKINLQRGPELEAAFGVPHDCYCPQVLVSVLLDVCAKTPVDVEIAPFASSDRDHVLSMLPSLGRGDVLVLDRGYPSHEVFQALAEENIDFLVRVPAAQSFSAIDKLREAGAQDGLFQFDPPQGAPAEWKTLTLRVLRLRAPDGTDSFFITTLRRGEFSRSQMGELYHMRWEAEEFYKLLKGPYIGQGQFRSKTAAGVRQEIHALILYLAIARMLMATAAEASGIDYASLSQKSAVLGLAAYVTRLFLEQDEDRALRELRALLQRVVRNRDKRRRRRSRPRVSFRPRLRWGPSGRCGA